MTKKFDSLVYIGRFQPPHKAHIQTIERALELSGQVKVFLGSAFEPRTLKNPWIFPERAEMIYRSLDVELRSRVQSRPLIDIPEDNEAWADQIRADADIVVSSKVGIIGHRKDASSFYLDLFPNWELVEMENIGGLNATDIREKYFNLPNIDLSWANDLPQEVVEYLKEFKNTDEYKELKNV